MLTFLVAYLSQILVSFSLPMVFLKTKKKVVSNGVCLCSCVLFSYGAFVLARSQHLVLGSVFFPFVRFPLHRLWTIPLAFCMAYM